MKIYYFAKELSTMHHFYGTGEANYFETKDALIKDAKSFFGNDAKKALTKEAINSIVCKDVRNYDFYSVQMNVDGFGHDTSTIACFKTKEECYNYKREMKNPYDCSIIVKGQYWGDYKEEWD